MNLKDNYLFKSKRLGFRNWVKEDLEEFAKINADSNVMEYFPSTLSKQESAEFLERLQKHFTIKGYTYFATELLHNGEFIGFIGLAYQTYETDFTPATDIGWRLKKEVWGNGYATEGAKRCLEFAFCEVGLDKVVAICTVNNNNSEKVMQKIGMAKQGEFKHPKLSEYPEFEYCVCYEIENKQRII